MARRLIALSGASVVGEKPKESAERLALLDYAKLLTQVERSRGSAEERMAYLKKLQEQQESHLGRRGKI